MGGRGLNATTYPTTTITDINKGIDSNIYKQSYKQQ